VVSISFQILTLFSEKMKKCFSILALLVLFAALAEGAPSPETDPAPEAQPDPFLFGGWEGGLGRRWGYEGGWGRRGWGYGWGWGR
jgi:hypothetical protein